MTAGHEGLGARLRAERERRGWTRAEMARKVRANLTGTQVPDLDAIVSYVKRHEAGKTGISDRYRDAYAAALDVDRAGLFAENRRAPVLQASDEIEALELVRRVARSDVGDATLAALELTVDDLATAYPRTPPAELLERIRQYMRYVAELLDARKTLSEHRRLLVVGGWLSLLASTCHIDLRQFVAAGSRLRTAAQLATEAEHPEILAWCLETEAWQAVTDGDYRHAVTLAHGARQAAPRNSSAYIQATAQEGRAWARLGAGTETRAALNEVNRLASALPVPDRPEHHYRYDPAKSDAYTATTLSWLGDPAAEPYARQVLARMDSTPGASRPRRAASARLDLALALLAAGKPEDAAQSALTAVTSGVLVPSNYWRAAEVVAAVQALGLPEGADLSEAYREVCGPGELLPGDG